MVMLKKMEIRSCFSFSCGNECNVDNTRRKFTKSGQRTHADATRKHMARNCLQTKHMASQSYPPGASVHMKDVETGYRQTN